MSDSVMKDCDNCGTLNLINSRKCRYCGKNPRDRKSSIGNLGSKK